MIHHSSKNCTIGVLRGLTHWAHLLCNQQEDFMFELNLLHDPFISNGYPKKLVKTAVKKSWKIELEKEMKALLLEQNEEQQEEKSDNYDVLHAPYIAGFSERLARDVKPIHTGLTFQKLKKRFS